MQFIIGILMIGLSVFTFVLALGFIMGFERHMKEHHKRSIQWKDLW